jgi:hypothetical protein
MAEYVPAREPEKEITIVVHPGDVVQVTDPQHRFRRSFGTVRECHAWGIGVDLTAIVVGKVSDNYERFKPGQFAVIGQAVLMSPDVQRARKESLQLAEEAAAGGAG